eukprot:c23481_g1_i1 orf=561-3896(-)
MAIVKKGSRFNRGSSASDAPARKSAGKPVGNGSSFPASSSDSSDSEPLEPIDGHLCQVGNQVCELPLELFDVPDLTQVLSLDTWNFVLSDEDREALFSLLPSMDEETYRSTLKGLFVGESFNFSSPLVDLWQLLTSGQCHLKAVRSREALTCLQRREHQHDVRVYQNGMVNRFLEMQHIWQGYPDSNIEERMEIWKAWKVKKVRLTPWYFYEKKAGPLQNRHFQSLLKRKASYLQAKEDAKASQLMSASAAPPDADSKVIGRSRVEPRPKKEVDLSVCNVFGNTHEKLKKPRPKGVLKLLPKPIVRTNVNIGMAQIPLPFNEMSTIPPPSYADAESSLEDKLFVSPRVHEPTALPSVEWSSASPVKEKVGFKLKSENKIKPTGIKRVKNVFSREGNEGSLGLSDKREKEVDGLESKARIEKELTQATALHEIQDVNFSSVAVEQMHAYPSGLDVHEGDDEPKKKVKRKSKGRDVEPVENGEGNLYEVNNIDDAFLAEKEVQDILDDKDEPDADEKPVKRRRKRLKSADDSPLPTQSCTLNGDASFSENSTPAKVSKKPSPSVPPIAMSFPFSIIHLLSAVRSTLTTFSSDQLMLLQGESSFTEHPINDDDYLMTPKAMYVQSNGMSVQGDDGVDVSKEPEEKKSVLPSVPLQEIVKKIQANPGDPRILETKEPLQGLVRGALKVLSSKTTQPGMKGWKPLVTYSRGARGWSWIGPLSLPSMNVDNSVVQISHEAWLLPQKTLYKLQELFGNWLKHEQEILQQLGQLALAPPLTTPIFLDEKERFRELRAQKSLITISPTSEEMRAYFRREEALRYSVPDRAFSYTCLDGRKSAVAPLRRIGGKPNSKARDHFMLKSDRPPHVTILCLVRDAAARLPGSIGTRADVCSLIRDSQYIVEDVSDAQLNQVVSGALDRLHYERDPCVRFDGDRKLWVYLHTDKDDEDFEDDATSSTKRWRRTKKEGIENTDFCLTQEYDYPGRDDQDSCGLGLDFSPTSCFGGPGDLSSVYSSAGRNELPFSHPNGSLSSPLVLESAFSGSGREDTLLPFIELPPSIQPPCVNMQQSHPMGWEVLSNRWEQDFQSHDHIVQEDYSAVASMASSHRESEVMIDGGM